MCMPLWYFFTNKSLLLLDSSMVTSSSHVVFVEHGEHSDRREVSVEAPAEY
jgi:hypothetical protein